MTQANLAKKWKEYGEYLPDSGAIKMTSKKVKTDAQASDGASKNRRVFRCSVVSPWETKSLRDRTIQMVLIPI